jgi:hypothetical protein
MMQRLTATVAAATGAAAPPTSSGTSCQPLRYSQRRRKKGLKRFFAQQPRRCSVPRATTQRQRICASRCCRDIVTIGYQTLFLSIRDYISGARVGRRCVAFEASPEERSASGSLRACLFERQRVCRPAAGVSTAVVGTLVPDAVGSAATPNPCARDVAKTAYTRSSAQW